jgi:hypothetical protein
VKQFALVLWSRDLNPDKYETLCRMLSKTYCKTGSPVSMLQLYLSVMTRGSCTTEENGTFLVRDFEARTNHSNHTPNTRIRGQSRSVQGLLLKILDDYKNLYKLSSGFSLKFRSGSEQVFYKSGYYHQELRARKKIKVGFEAYYFL